MESFVCLPFTVVRFVVSVLRTETFRFRAPTLSRNYFSMSHATFKLPESLTCFDVVDPDVLLTQFTDFQKKKESLNGTIMLIYNETFQT